MKVNINIVLGVIIVISLAIIGSLGKWGEVVVGGIVGCTLGVVVVQLIMVLLDNRGEKMTLLEIYREWVENLEDLIE